MRGHSCVMKLTEQDEVSTASFSITCCTEQDWHSVPYCRTVQLCKYSSCYIWPQSSLYTHSPSYDGRQCGDYRCWILWRIDFGALTVNIIHWPKADCGSLPTCCTWLFSVWCFCVHFLYIYITLY